jgi:hypothetical protein
MAEGAQKYADSCEGAGGDFSCSCVRTGCVMIMLRYVSILLRHILSSSKTNAGEVRMMLLRFVYEITVLLRI